MILKYGSSSNSKQAVRALHLLMDQPMSDKFTLGLRTAVRDFQLRNGLDVDGIAGPQTLSTLARQLPQVMYKDYSRSKYVKAVQALVSTTIDGKYGDKTRKNVLALQVTAGIAQTGDVDTNTWLALWGCSYVQTAPTVTTGTNTAQPVDYKQGDKRWGKKPYTATGNKSQTIGSSGCGPTSMADIMATWIDKNITPVEMCQYALDHGYRTANSGTAWAFFKSIAQAYGFTGFVQTKSMATARAALKNGAFVVASMGPGYWTTGGHFICLWKTDDTYMYANDPASSSRKKQKLKPFEEQRKQFFIFYKPTQTTEDNAGGGDGDGMGGVDSGGDSGAGGGDEPVAPLYDEAPKAIIDISKWQGSIDFDALKPHVSLVIARASCGSDKDVRFDEHAGAMVQRGIPFGVFCYSYCRDWAKGEDEAIRIAQYAGPYHPLFYVIDIEESCVTQAGVRAFVRTLRDLGVTRVGAYVAHHRYREYRFDELRDLFDFVWIPRYASPDLGKPTGKYPDFNCDLWQYTEKGTIAGIQGAVDMNMVTGTGKSLRWLLGGEG